MGQSMGTCCTMRDQGDKSSVGTIPKPEVDAKRKQCRRKTIDELQKVVMGRYMMKLGRNDLMGEGSNSVCRRGVDLTTNTPVAIKTYKSDENFEEASYKFRRQIEVLKELMKPFEKPCDDTLWCERLARTDPKRLFMQLVDYSKDENGQPAPDPADGVMYTVTELAECSLKDFIRGRRETSKKMSRDTVQNITKAVLLVIAGLHAKGLVHIDVKPENLMIFDGVLKLIDVEGCLRIGATASVDDGNVSFSPVYCAPEWARLLASESHEIVVTPSLDVWSVGMTICELVICKPALASVFAGFYTNGRSREEASCLYMDWLRNLPGPPIPVDVERFDARLYHLLKDSLLVLDPTKRQSLANSLSHEYTRSESRKNSGPLTYDVDSAREFYLPAVAHIPSTVGDTCDDEVIHRGVLWKLRPGEATDCAKEDRWVECDAWLANNGSLFVSAEGVEESILFEGSQLATALISECEEEEVRPTIQVLIMQSQGIDIAVEPEETPSWAWSAYAAAGKDASDRSERKWTWTMKSDRYLLGCASEEERDSWMCAFEAAQHATVGSMKLTSCMVERLCSRMSPEASYCVTPHG